jgi:hypothetical protein
MNDPLDPRIRELGWRQQLTKAEEAELFAWLAAHPETRDHWELEWQLTRLIEKTPEAPKVASNFTAQVMLAVAREAAIQARAPAKSRWDWRPWRSWLPHAVAASLIAGIGLFAWRQQQLHARALMAQSVARLAEAVSTLGPEPVQHYDPIRRLGDAPPEADTELSALLTALNPPQASPRATHL